MQRPTEDRFLMTKEELERKIAVLLGGRAAEKLVFDHLSTGASDDLARTTDIARSMVTRYGMDEQIGHIVYDDNHQTFLGQQGYPSQHRASMSDATAQLIDSSVKNIVDTIFSFTMVLLEKNREVMERCATALLEKETLDEAELRRLTEHMHRLVNPEESLTPAAETTVEEVTADNS